MMDELLFTGEEPLMYSKLYCFLGRIIVEFLEDFLHQFLKSFWWLNLKHSKAIDFYSLSEFYFQS